MDACQSNILESTKAIELKLGFNIDGNAGKGRTQEP